MLQWHVCFNSPLHFENSSSWRGQSFQQPHPRALQLCTVLQVLWHRLKSVRDLQSLPHVYRVKMSPVCMLLQTMYFLQLSLCTHRPYPSVPGRCKCDPVVSICPNVEEDIELLFAQGGKKVADACLCSSSRLAFSISKNRGLATSFNSARHLKPVHESYASLDPLRQYTHAISQWTR